MKESKYSVKTEEIIKELKKVAFHNLSDVIEINVDEDINVKDINYNDKAIKSLEINKGKIKIVFYDKLKALEILGRFLKEEGEKITNDKQDIIVNFKGISNYKSKEDK